MRLGWRGTIYGSVPSAITIVRCLIISPSDSDDLREAVEEALNGWNAQAGRQQGLRIEPVLWQSHGRPTIAAAPQSALNAQIVDDADLAVAIFRARVGTPTDTAESGSVEEIERLRRLGREVMVFFSEEPISREHLDLSQLEALGRLRERLSSEALVETFQNPADLVRVVILKVPPVAVGLVRSANAPPVDPDDTAIWGQLDETERIWLRLLWRHGGRMRQPEVGEALADDVTVEQLGAAEYRLEESLDLIAAGQTGGYPSSSTWHLTRRGRGLMTWVTRLASEQLRPCLTSRECFYIWRRFSAEERRFLLDIGARGEDAAQPPQHIIAALKMIELVREAEAGGLVLTTKGTDLVQWYTTNRRGGTADD